MKKVLMLLMILVLPMVSTSFGIDRMSALSMLETGNNDRMVGRAGEISRYQILKKEWQAVTRSRNYTNPGIARTVALRIIEKRLKVFEKKFNRQPTDWEFYALWNAPGQLYRNKISSRVAERCDRYANLCSIQQQAGLNTPR